METATIKEIDKDRLYALIKAFPDLWNKDKPLLDPGLIPLLDKYGETDELFFGVYLFAVVRGLLTVFVEYQRTQSTATFEIHGYIITGNGIEGRHQYAEQKLRDIILGHAGEAFTKLTAISKDRIFECPSCKAKYSLMTMKMSSDGRIECQNCGRLVDFKIKDKS